MSRVNYDIGSRDGHVSDNVFVGAAYVPALDDRRLVDKDIRLALNIIVLLTYMCGNPVKSR